MNDRKISLKVAKEIMLEIDKDGDGTINFDEFALMIKNLNS